MVCLAHNSALPYLSRLVQRASSVLLLFIKFAPLVLAQTASPTSSFTKAKGSSGFVSGVNPQDISDLRGRTPFLPLDAPEMVPATEANYLPDEELVLGLDLPEGKRAYPLRMVSWHHILNVLVGMRPILVTYCKACNAGIAFDSKAQGRSLTFSLYGYYQHSFVMFDRETEGLWYQLDGKSLQGKWKGSQLQMLPLVMTDWKRWKALHPSTLVLGSNPTQFATYPPMEASLSGKGASDSIRFSLGIALAGCMGALGLFTLRRRRIRP